LNDLARRAATILGLSVEQICAALMKREALGSTGTGDGVAIPHARVPGIGKPFGMLVRLEKAVDFDSIDDRKVDILFLLLLPENSPGGQGGGSSTSSHAPPGHCAIRTPCGTSAARLTTPRSIRAVTVPAPDPKPPQAP
jgi:hypothetical protein